MLIAADRRPQLKVSPLSPRLECSGAITAHYTLSSAHRNQSRRRKKPRSRLKFREVTQAAATRTAPGSPGAPRPARVRSAPASRPWGLRSPGPSWALPSSGRVQPPPPAAPAAAELPAPRRNQKKSARGARASGAGPGAAVFSVPGSQNIDFITPKKRGHNIFGYISKRN
nr:translation initiation factor IF-2-like [Saimiri boliviensis boliviensis]